MSDRRLHAFSLPLATPFSTAAGELSEREGYLVGVERAADGVAVRGLGEATPLAGWTESLDECHAALDGDEDIDPSATPAAAHGAELAVLDAEARAAGRSLADLLADRIDSGEPAERVPVNATIGDGTVDETVGAAKDAVDAGFDCLKLKVGARSIGDDLKRVWGVSDAVDADLRLDANGAWDRETAGEVVKLLGGVDIEYVEQPLPADDLEGLAGLRGYGVDIAVDESLRLGVDAVLDADAADVAVLKPMALGGPAAAVDAAARLHEEGVDPVVTTTIDGAVARAAAVHAAAAIPDVRACGLATGDLLSEEFGADPVPVENGEIAVPDGPGNLGETFDSLVWGA